MSGPLTAPVKTEAEAEQEALLVRVNLGVSISLLVLALVPFSVRVYQRAWPRWRFMLEDYLISAGLACSIADWGLLRWQVDHLTTEHMRKGIMLAYFAIVVRVVAVTLIKTSVIVTLIRLPLKRSRRLILYLLIGVQVMYCVAVVFYSLFRCRPLESAWDINVTPTGNNCPPRRTGIVILIAGAAVNILTDFLVSVAPVILLWNLRRPAGERALLCVLSSLGIVASTASIVKLVVLVNWLHAGLESRQQTQCETTLIVATWTVVEQFLSILAACGPSLKRPIQHVLSRFGITLVRPEPQISFEHMPSRLPEGKLRRQVREWLGEDDDDVAGFYPSRTSELTAVVAEVPTPDASTRRLEAILDTKAPPPRRLGPMEMLKNTLCRDGSRSCSLRRNNC